MTAATIAMFNAFKILRMGKTVLYIWIFSFEMNEDISTEALDKKHSLWPALKSWDSEEGHHGSQDIVEVKLAVLPAPGLDHWLTDLTILVCDVVSSVGGKERESMAELHFRYLPWEQVGNERG